MAEQSPEDAFLASMQSDLGGSNTAVGSGEVNAAVPGTQPSQPISQQEPQQHSQLRTLGGFIVDDDDDDEEEADDDQETHLLPTVPDKSDAASLNIDSSAAKRSLNNSPINAMPSAASVHSPAQSLSRPSSNVNGAANTALMPEPVSTTPVPFVQSPVAGQEGPGAASLTQRPALAAVPGKVNTADAVTPTNARLPNDRIGILEDRIAEDPRGDTEAWLSLIDEYKRRNDGNAVRSTYDRLLKWFPAAAGQWVNYVKWELDSDQLYPAEQIFRASLHRIPYVPLWSMYLNHVRRRHNTTTDTSGQARSIITQCFQRVLEQVGHDKDSGPIWQEYVQFVRDGPGQIGGTTWQDQQKVDMLREVYKQAVCQPTSAVTALWKEYNAFEMGLNKMNGRKLLQERSPAYVTASTSYNQLQNITRELDPDTMPKLPPALGFDGDLEYVKQVSIWQKWLEWEKEDPLVIKKESPSKYRSRVLHVYILALIPLRFWPEMWYDAAEWCFDNALNAEGEQFLQDGASANPESCLLAFRLADRIESTTSGGDDPESLRQRGDKVRQPFDRTLDALYALSKKTKRREEQQIQALEREPLRLDLAQRDSLVEDEEDYDPEALEKAAQDLRNTQIEAIKNGNAAQVEILTRSISAAWIALMRAMRRVQGKGGKGASVESVGGMRQVFADARKRGSVTSEVYVANALLEHYCYKDPAASKIFERGLKLFKEDEKFILEYLKHLVATNDITNARATFETTVSKLVSQPETVNKAKPLFAYFHEFETCYGELSQIKRLEKRMAELFPDDSQLKAFARRYATPDFDPTAIRLIISPATQARPKALPIPAEQSAMIQNSPPTISLAPPPVINSPKRALEDSDNDGPVRKLARADSPLKGAAGRRMNAAKQNTQLRNEIGGAPSNIPFAAAPTLPREVNFLLGILPRAELWDSIAFIPEKITELLLGADLGRANLQPRPPQPPLAQPPGVAASAYAFPPNNLGYR